MYAPDECLMLSGLQHFRFCRRQWALIHLEQQWQENLLTTEGELMHQRAHDEGLVESRGDVLIVRGLRVQSLRLGLSGQCDVVEFRRVTQDGIPLSGRDGLWLPFLVEYKHGEPKTDACDEIQLCAQALCLEEMLCCQIPAGALFYGEIRRRHPVSFTPELRKEVETTAEQMHDLYRRGHTPRVKPSKACTHCSLREICLPRMPGPGSVKEYLRKSMEEAP